MNMTDAMIAVRRKPWSSRRSMQPDGSRGAGSLPQGLFSRELGKILLTQFQPEIHTVSKGCRARADHERSRLWAGPEQAQADQINIPASPKLLNEVEDAMASGSVTRRGKIVRHITDLF